jgi:hypothetical protein
MLREQDVRPEYWRFEACANVLALASGLGEIQRIKSFICKLSVSNFRQVISSSSSLKDIAYFEISMQ